MKWKMSSRKVVSKLKSLDEVNLFVECNLYMIKVCLMLNGNIKVYTLLNLVIQGIKIEIDMEILRYSQCLKV